MAAIAKHRLSSRRRGISANGEGPITVRLTRTEIIDSLEKAARARVGLSARVMLRRYREGRLPDPGRVTDLIALSNLLRKNDPILVE
jgi:hypothetical protein